MAKVAKKTSQTAAKKASNPNKPMTKSEVAAHMAEKVGISKKEAQTFFEVQAELAYTQAKKNDKGFTLPGIGKLVVVKRGPRTFRNPQTGEAVKKPASKALKFRIAKPAKDAVLPAAK